MKYLDKIFQIATKIKNPLSIIGLVIIILYLIIKQILSLNIYENIGAANTYLFLSNILDKIFWFALASLITGLLSYAFLFYYKKKTLKKSNVRLIDARVDSNLSNYKQEINQKQTIIRPDKKDDNNK